MCRSVPQIDAVRTRTSTSAGPIEGTGALSSESPRAACILRKAFIVDDMESGSWWDAIGNRSTAAASRRDSTGIAAVVILPIWGAALLRRYRDGTEERDRS